MLTKEAWSILSSPISTKIAERKHNELFDFFQQNVRVRLEHSCDQYAHYVRPKMEVQDFYGNWHPTYDYADTVELKKPKLME